jgi:hypothetical protein
MDEKLNEVLKILTIAECKLQKIKKEQTENKSECSKTKIELINRKLQVLQNILIEIG